MYEASDILLGDHLSEKSCTVQWIAVEQPHKRKRRLKNHAKLKELADNNPDSTEIFEKKLIDDYYPTRPEDLKNVCLYDFVKWYTYKHTDASGNRVYQKLKKPRLQNHRLYDPSKENEREEYYYSLLLLFVPFRNEEELVENNESAENAFSKFIQSNSEIKEHHEKLSKLLQAQKKVCKINEHRDATEGEECSNEEADGSTGLEIAGEAKSAMHDICELTENVMDDVSLNEKIEMLNKDQRRVFDMISDHLKHQKQHEIGECLCAKRKPLQLFISGVWQIVFDRNH